MARVLLFARNSSITTPHRLPYFNALYSIRVLLTPTERRRPWTIYLTPGLLAAQFTHLAYKIVLVGTLRRVLIPDLSRADTIKADGVLFVKIGIMLAVGVLSTFILCPLEVIAAKLAIQRNHAAPEYNSVAQELEDDAITGEEYAEYSGAEEDVIGYVSANSSRVSNTDRWLLAACATNVIHTLG